MEAPVPISAQLHSSTLVIIGFYVYYRFFSFISINSFVKHILFIFSSFTILGATFLAFFQNDGKKLLACSTASQLGYVILTLSLNLVDESLNLLVFCCCNKAVTFVWFGVIMDSNNGVSDLRLLKNYSFSFFEKSGLLCAIMNSTIGPSSMS